MSKAVTAGGIIARAREKRGAKRFGDGMIATEYLADEHETIKLALRILDALCWRYDEGKYPNPDHCQSILDFFITFTEQNHHAKEEEFLFPAIIKFAPAEETASLITTLLREHDRGRVLVTDMMESLYRLKRGAAAAASAFTAQARDYIAVLTLHIEKESAVLYRLADRVIDKRLQRSLIDRFEELERNRIGIGRKESIRDLLRFLQTMYLG